MHRRQEPEVREVRYAGIEAASPTAAVAAALARRSRRSSSGRPTRSCRSGRSWPCPGCASSSRGARARGVPVVAVSGIVGGRALKGPADRMLALARPRGQRRPVSRAILAGCGRRRSSSMTLDRAMEPASRALGLRTLVTDTVMADQPGRARLARTVLEFASAMTPRAGPEGGRLAAIIPVGTLEDAKTRLGAALDAEERQDLAERLVRSHGHRSARRRASRRRPRRQPRSRGAPTWPPTWAPGPSASDRPGSTPAWWRPATTWSRAAPTRSSCSRSTSRS